MMKQYQNAENRIDRTMIIDGNITFKGATVVEGSVRGDIQGGKIIITETGRVEGDMIMEEVVCQGKMTGTISTKSFIVGPNAKVKGDVTCSELGIEPGAVVNCLIKREGSPVREKGIDKVVSLKEEGNKIEERTIVEKEGRKSDEPVSTPSIEPIEPEGMIVIEPTPVSHPVSMEAVTMNGFFTGGGRKKIVRTIIEEVQASKEIIKVIGDMGSGKTTVCQKVCEILRQSFTVVYLDDVIGSMKNLFFKIAKELDVQIDENSSQNDILERLEESIQRSGGVFGSVVIVLDNCQEMYPATLEGVIKNLSRCFSDDRALMQIVLFGDSFLDQNLDPKAIDYFMNNPACAFELKHLSENETNAYIDFKIEEIQKCMNSDRPADFPDDARGRVYTYSQGLIGKIDRIVEEAMELAGKKKSRSVAAKFVKNI